MTFHRFMLRTALAASQIFAWIFMFHLSFVRTGNVAHALVATLLLYALCQIATILLTPFAARLLGNGIVRMMVYGTLALTAAFVFWGAAFSGLAGGHLDSALVLGALFLGAFRALYTVPYALMRPLGKGVSLVTESMIALAPAVVGLLLARVFLSPSQLLFLAAALAIASLVSLARIPEYYERFTWGYRQTFGELFEPRERSLVVRAFGHGVESAALFLIWPILIFALLGSYLALGIIVALLFLSLLLARFVRENIIRVYGMPLSHGSVAVSAWALRLVAFEPLTMVLVNAYGALGNPASADEHMENSTYLDERSALKGVAAGLGRLLCAVFAVAAITILPLFAAFVFIFALAALVAGAAAYARQTRIPVPMDF